MKKLWPPRLAEEAENEAYLFMEKYLGKKFRRKEDGTIDKDTGGFQHNDVDALRHAYVSGVFVMEYNEFAANVLGHLNELRGGSPLNLRPQGSSRNMDLWNNKVGRKYGKKSKTRLELFKYLIEALKKGELIIRLDDPRKFSDEAKLHRDLSGWVIVLKESESGENLVFFDVEKKEMLSKDEFVAKIKNGEYQSYELRNIRGKETPVSKKDGVNFNNLG